MTKLILTALALIALPLSANAQLDLPDDAGKARTVTKKPRSEGGDLAPHLVCTVCGTRNYTAPRDRPAAETDQYYAICTYCREDRRHRDSGGSSKGNIDLPDRKLEKPVRPVRPDTNPSGSDSKLPVAPLVPGKLSSQARFILEQVGRSNNAGSSLEAQAERGLIALGEDGVFAARIALLDERASLIKLGANVLLNTGRGVEIERVALRLRDSLPGRIGPGILNALVATDPVHASPALLCDLLDHKQGAVRKTAAGHLEKILSPSLLPSLRGSLDSKRISTRVEAIDLIAQVDDPSTMWILLEHLSDSSPTVCERVLSALVRREDDRLDVELLKLAFGERLILRPSAYALLAVIDREDRGQRAILDQRHARSLLIGLESRLPMVSGTCAAALAGIGFRSAPSESNAWLNDQVPTELVSVVSGADFHPDYAALQSRAMRRLELISGERLGANANEWVGWWLAEREGFSALRALFPVSPEELPHFVLRYHSPEGAFVLSGAAEADALGVEERVVIGDLGLETLVDSLRQWGLLSAELLPGVYGRRSSDERKLTLQLGSQTKTFILGKGREASWFSSVEELFYVHRERQKWQRFVPFSEEGSGAWFAEVMWWESDQDELSRALRMKRHLFNHLQSVTPYERRVGLSELESVFAVDGAGMITDLDPLLELISDETLHSGRARKLVSLARQIIQGENEGAEAARRRLLLSLLEQFGESGIGSAAALLHDFTGDSLLAFGADESPLLRSLVAAHLSGSDLPEEQALLIAFLEDDDPRVEAAAVASLGHIQLESARTELLLRARLSEGIVRQAALEACGRLGGEGVQEALINGLADRDLNYQLSALRGLALLADPDQIPFFVSYLQLGESSPHYQIAFRALEEFGPLAHSALLRIAGSKRHKAQRAAALLLARVGKGEVADSLVSIMESAEDAEVAHELAVLTCFDLRSSENAALEYREWLELGGHRDSWRWFQEAVQRRELECPPQEDFQGEGTRAAALFLADVLSKADLILAERARRELEVLLGVVISARPGLPGDRMLWSEALLELIDRAYPLDGGEE